MKFKFSLIIVVCFAVMLCSCRKNNEVNNNGIFGKWQLTEIYNGYVNGGDFLWHNVSFNESHTLEFTAAGQYSKQENSTGNFGHCSGTYQLFTGGNLEVTSNCSTIVERMKISESTNQELIIDRPGIEGVTRYKYIVGK